MNAYQNKEVKKYLWLTLLLGGAAIVALLLVTLLEWNTAKTQENQVIMSFVQEITEQYPDVNIEDLLTLLNQKEGREPDVALQEKIRQYGISDDVFFIARMEQVRNRTLVGNGILLALIELVLVGIFLRYLKKRQNQLNVLAGYMDQISRGKYALDLADNSEDELSNLKNELYKITLNLKEQAKVSQEKREALADSVSDISHQLKTPLTSISVLLDNLMDSEQMKPEIRQKFLGEISHQVTFLNWMSATLLKLSRLDAGVVSFEKQEIQVYQLLEEIQENLEIMAELKDVQIDIIPIPEKSNATVTITGDYNWNREALQNIVKNAIEHSLEHAVVQIQLESNDVFTKISIINRGKTIPQEEQKHIFERFYRATDAAENSVGIGLSLSKTILEQQNAYVKVESMDGVTSFIVKYL